MEDRRRAPEASVLHEAFRRGWPEVSSGVPTRVKLEVQRYLDCGQLRCGFVEVKCEACSESWLVAFSCKACPELVEGDAGGVPHVRHGEPSRRGSTVQKCCPMWRIASGHSACPSPSECEL